MVCKWRVAYMVTMESLIEEIKEYNPTTDESLIRRAYAIAEEAHDGQMCIRDSLYWDAAPFGICCKHK